MSHHRRVPPAAPPTAADLQSLLQENHSVKLISPAEESVGGRSLTLDESTAQWLESIQHSWNTWKKSPNTVGLLRGFFDSVDNPFLCSLKLLVYYRCKTDCKNNTLPYITMDELNKWSIAKLDQCSNLLSSETQNAALTIAKERKNTPFLKLVADTYRIPSHLISEYVGELLDLKQYTVANSVIVAFKLKKDNIVDDLLLPLILQDKTASLDEYLAAFPDQALVLVEFLDSFLVQNSNTKDLVYNYMTAKKMTVCEIRWDRIHYKIMGKLITRVCNRHGISLSSVCKNLTNQRAVGGLRYLIHQRYNNNISDNAWNDMVIDSINENPQLIQELITLVDHYNTKDACKWAKFFNYPEDMLPPNMRLYLQLYVNKEEEEEDISTPSTSQVVKYYALKTTVNVVFIDTRELFLDAVCNGISNECLIGIDSEWKPSFGTRKSTVSLIQVSTRSAVFLFDALKFNSDEFADLWDCLLKNVLENPNIMKLGFGVENDMREIKSSIVGLKMLRYKDFNFIELLTLWKAVTQAGAKLPHKKENNGEGLTAIVQQCFGPSLKKHEQCSNWEIRPLRQSQIEYAALDAYVLLEIYDLFDELCQTLNLSLEDVCNRVRESAEKARMKKTKKKVNERYKNFNKGPNDQPVSPENTKLLLETCLGGLAKYLRCSGIDVDVMTESETWNESTQKASKENRYIVIKYFNSKKVSKNVPRTHVYILESCYVEEQFKEVYYYFNIQITKSSLFSICDDCNSNDMTVVAQHVMRKMKTTDKLQPSTTKSHTTPALTPQHSYHHQDDDGYDDYDDTFLSDNEDDNDYIVPTVQHLVLSPDNIDIDQCLTRFKVGVQIERITEDIIEKNQEFHICQPCGKCFYVNGYLPENLFNVIMYMMPNTLEKQSF